MDTHVPKGLRPQELEAVYEISRAIAQSLSIDVALDQIVRLTRPVFIFDNVVLYLGHGGSDFEPTFARVIGRGRSAEADLAWGESVALEVCQSQATVARQEKLDDWQENRLSWREFLGLPIRSNESLLGALVFGRFGGPPYESDQVHLAEFIAAHIAQLLEHQKLVERVADLEAEKRLRRMQSDFIATISHELVTPLGFIKGYATTLLREDQNWDEQTQREFLGIISHEADRLRDLIDNLLDSSRLQAGTLRMQLQVVDLGQLLQDIAMRELNCLPGMQIQIQVSTGINVWADPMRIAQVFENLLSNAAKYAPGSPVYIAVEKAGGMYCISVADEGRGIAPEHLENLFERFYRVPVNSPQVHGSGLGLFICRQIVEAHGGRIEVESEVSIGTTFRVYLPAAMESA